ncbi:MAG: hypothetical protein QOG93_674 [Gaiellaceae bacterium]|nr:hypothetical protein [Gaiellaceae bacterium]MDX6387612.1 hypothetical protein [Gaiellaceae bacterium]MDX6435378.1 hypothetical protein [Gaiellaceae bacterium]
MRTANRSDPVLILAGIAYFIDLFLHWSSASSGLDAVFTGWDVSIANTSGQSVIALLLVELLRVTGIWQTRTSALLAFFLAAGTAVLVVTALAHVHWGGFYHVPLGEFGYGAWLALTLALVLAVGAVLVLPKNDVGVGGGEGVGSAT